MKIDPLKWNRNAALVYAVGAWTTLGYIYYQYQVEGDKRRVEKLIEENGSNVEVYETKYTQTVIYYKKDHTPKSSWFIDYIKSTFGTPVQRQNETRRNELAEEFTKDDFVSTSETDR